MSTPTLQDEEKSAAQNQTDVCFNGVEGLTF